MNKRYPKLMQFFAAFLLLAVAGFAHAIAPITCIYQEPELSPFHHDLSGNTIAATDASGNVLYTEQYRPYGDRLTNDAASQTGQLAGNRIWFHGKVQDEATGLQYFGARYYDPVIGRFMGVDPVGFDPANLHSANRYAYGNNNPYKYRDPNGMWAEDIVLAPISLGTGAHSFNENIKAGNWGSAVVDVLGMAADVAAVTLPGVPAVAGITIKAGREGVEAAAKGSKELNIQENPRNLIPTQTKSEMSGSQVKRLEKDMKKNGFDQSKPVDARRNPDTGRLEIQDGHHRTEAAKKVGLDKIPVRVWQ